MMYPAQQSRLNSNWLILSSTSTTLIFCSVTSGFCSSAKNMPPSKPPPAWVSCTMRLKTQVMWVTTYKLCWCACCFVCLPMTQTCFIPKAPFTKRFKPPTARAMTWAASCTDCLSNSTTTQKTQRNKHSAPTAHTNTYSNFLTSTGNCSPKPSNCATLMRSHAKPCSTAANSTGQR